MPTESTPSSSNPALAAYSSPIGSLTLAARGGALIGLWGAGQRFFGSPYGIDEAVARSALDLTSPVSRDVILAEAGWGEADARALGAAMSWLDGYFAGEAPSPATVRLAPAGTDFQKRVWEAMDAIPYGATHTYGHLAATMRGAGIPASAQAVGGAVGRNPLLLIRPCHRVVAADGPGGYAAGAEAKAWLLAHEAATASSVS
ncbi:methylated-DNA-[protein]-cysteine S-methyltransferase [Actinomyces sp. HPA0247]|uniref:methylated-DNA--[protein]-cysteine S-methyltransferase n=1 Tax=Actinomyces sp. HPA0247 TaxID=1203556 RepID=UPI00034E4F3A|nr:methylated-DNA--[protein]-cysteine S-methyltransferase [Actinomyces sp. HPA0247]EPD72282.1 methylated-DNA-[protein]-cysteine S-methyltransferase [Actinomyces sp. HPA0247]MBS6969191.1 methylated-DNA--[protein]-cysteine S-methyltransferase [Actinomyces sp.]MDU5164272.1 methylated-DNA--[protein]-cysteine S-methyltransferase [Actinomyces sp.]